MAAGLLQSHPEARTIIEIGGHLLTTFLPKTLFAQHPDWFLHAKGGALRVYNNIGPDNAAQLRGTGIAGVAVIRAILGASDPAAVVRDLRSALAPREMP